MKRYLVFRTKPQTGNHRFRTVVVETNSPAPSTAIYIAIIQAKTKAKARKIYLNRNNR